MFVEQDTLAKIIKNAITRYQEQIEKLVEQNNSSFEKFKTTRRLIEEDINNITTISLEELAEVIAEVPLSEEERELEFNFLKSVRKLLELNQTKKTTFQLSERQKKFVQDYIEQLKQLEVQSEQKIRANLEDASSITEKMKELKSILDIIEDSHNKSFIEQSKIITKLMDELEVDDSIQRSILYGILRYNQSIYESKMNEELIPEQKWLNAEEVEKLFEKYGYHFRDLKEDLQESILSYGNVRQMDGVFACLQQEQFPVFDLKKNGTKLAAILINGDSRTIKEAVLFSKEKGIDLKHLLSVLPAMIPQSPRKKWKETEPSAKKGANSPFITGRSEDYKKNIEFLESVGFKIDYIFRKCKEILVMSNERLVANYRKFIEYGFTISKDEYGDLTHPALSCLMSTNFDEIVDQFIEISPRGHEYIKENMSRIVVTPTADDLLFYNIYASYLEQNELGDSLVPEGPFNDSQRKIRLRGEITRYRGSGYEDVPYRGITEENKREKTMTIAIDCQNKKVFDEAVNLARGKDGELYNLVFDDARLLDLESYTDINNPIRYNFDGVFISKKKVARILNVLKNSGLDNLDDSLLYAITYNSIMNQEAFDKIKKIIRDRRK